VDRLKLPLAGYWGTTGNDGIYGEAESWAEHAELVFAAFGLFIQQKVHQLLRHKKYDNKTREAVQHQLSLNVDGDFPWVALVYQNLKDVPRRNVIKKLNAFPPGLNALYDPTMQHITNSDDADADVFK
jgi:hypothetical protein